MSRGTARTSRYRADVGVRMLGAANGDDIGDPLIRARTGAGSSIAKQRVLSLGSLPSTSTTMLMTLSDWMSLSSVLLCVVTRTAGDRGQ
jgi:hypothetical protein